jgi:hypothetical protein
MLLQIKFSELTVQKTFKRNHIWWKRSRFASYTKGFRSGYQFPTSTEDQKNFMYTNENLFVYNKIKEQ